MPETVMKSCELRPRDAEFLNMLAAEHDIAAAFDGEPEQGRAGHSDQAPAEAKKEPGRQCQADAGDDLNGVCGGDPVIADQR
jgi:hypothetical protein